MPIVFGFDDRGHPVLSDNLKTIGVAGDLKVEARTHSVGVLRLIPDFPPSFGNLRDLYRGFRPEFEYRRQSFADWWSFYLRQLSLKDLEAELNTSTERASRLRRQLKQRHFYRSATSLWRAFDLFLGYLSLQNHMFGTWAEVTGYYSRFYFVQGFLNLLQASWFGAEDSIPADGLVDPHDRKFFVYNTGERIHLLRQPELLRAIGTDRLGSHGIWWKIYASLGDLPDFPQFESLSFVLGDGYFNVERRNEVNYSHEYIRGFPELEWFDSSTESMIAQLHCQVGRADRDITNIDRFFAGYDPESVDIGDFYGDEAQMLWCSIDCYLRLLRLLGVEQNFITVEKLGALTREHIGHDLPILTEGIVTGVHEGLADT